MPHRGGREERSTMRGILAAAVTAGLLGTSAHAQTPTARSDVWTITKAEWTEADEKGFGDFVRAIGHSGCTGTVECLRVAANPYRDSDPKNLKFIADCADFPYMLRAYYAWKNGLPFSYVNVVSGKGSDIRFEGGNHPSSRHDLVDHGQGLAPVEILSEIHVGVWSATYRTNPGQEGGVLSDFYSPKIQPGTIRPGTAVYDTNGHVGLVYDIEADGRIDYMDAHPDFTVTRSVYGAQFGQSPAKLGGGLKNWRPMKLVGAKSEGGRLIGGRVVVAPNSEIPDFSMEQYTGNVAGTTADGENARFQYNNVELGFYEYIRVAVSGGQPTYNPVYELRSSMRTLCNDLKDRALAVDLAVKDGISKKAEPAHLPDNIYNANDEEWESYSTPSRDARLKTAYAQLYIDLQKMLFLWQQRDPRLVYDGLFLKEDLQKMYAQEAAACSVTYTNSRGEPVTLGFDDIGQRLFQIDFDPYHCIERRWGAKGDELASCTDDETKGRWYKAEQRLRNQIDRTYEARMGFTVVQLEKAVDNSGADAPPTIDVKGMIDHIGERVAFAGMKPVGR
jgi:hypothetical protein